MSTYAKRKLRILRELAQMQVELDAAEAGSLSWDFRNRLLEKVEQLPKGEQEHWKCNYLERLKKATEPLEDYQERQAHAAQIPTQQGIPR